MKNPSGFAEEPERKKQLPRPEATVVLPTFHERATVARTLRLLDENLSLRPYSCEILVVDDNSNDGTVEAVLSTPTQVETRVIVRNGEKGLASAILRGFKEAQGRVCAVLDADGSHPPTLVPELLDHVLSGRVEMALASRYVGGGGVMNWHMHRRLLSLGATLLAWPLTQNAHVWDPMSGFFAVEKEILKRARLNPIGYKMGFEILVRCRPHPVVEIPYHFQDRLAGESKLTPQQIGEYVRHLLQLYRYVYLRGGSLD